MSIPWVEKYRPRKISSVKHQNAVKNLLAEGVKQGVIPHLIFYGPPGTGKTTLIYAFAREVFGEHWKSRYFELNASDDRGIAVVRERIKTWAKQLVTLGPEHTSTDEGSEQHVNPRMPPWKMIILDEADHMTHDAQTSLRRMIEDYSDLTKFIFICNNLSRIIEPLQSRAAKCRFVRIPEDAQAERLNEIIQKENINVAPNLVQDLVELSNGDLRRAITILQSVAQLSDRQISGDMLREVAGLTPQRVIDNLITACKTSATPGTLTAVIQEVCSDGYNVNDIIKAMLIQFVERENLSEIVRAMISFSAGLYQMKLVEGGDPYIELLAFCLEARDHMYVYTSTVGPDLRVFMGEDKYENELLIQWGWPEDVWFHVDNFSSAHVYVRLPSGMSIDTMPNDLVQEMCQLTKNNSIEGSKQSTVDVVYTKWSNLKKDVTMDVGTVSFVNHSEVKKVKNVSRDLRIIKPLEKSKKEVKIDFQAEREARDRKLLQEEKYARKAAKQQQEADRKAASEAFASKHYLDIKADKETETAKGDGSIQSCREAEEDFM